MKHSFFAALMGIISLAAFGQDVPATLWKIEDYDWEATPQPETRAEIRVLEEAITKSVVLLEYRYVEDNLELYELEHRKAWIGSEKTIESYNRIYVPLMEDDKTARIKARVLQPDGKVIYLDEDDIEEGKDEDDNIYRYFALTGVKVGSVVEYLFLTRSYPQLQGVRYTLQRDAPTFDLRFDLVTPGNLVFKLKSYNGIDDAQTDTTLTAQNRFYINQTYVPKFEKEEMAYERAHMGYVIFAVDRNLYNGMRDLSSFGFAAANIFGNVGVPLSKKMEKEYKKIVAQTGTAKAKDEKEKVHLLENYLKEHFFTQDASGNAALMDVDQILDNKVMNDLGCLRLYYTLFTYAGIQTELVFTSDRSTLPFDPAFENSLFLRENLLYFPQAQEFIAPANQLTRMGCFDAELRHTQALFVSGVDLGDGPSGIGEVRYIPPQNITDNRSNMVINWTLAPDGEPGNIAVVDEMWGQQSGGIQTLVPFVPEENMEEFRKTILSNYYPEVELKDLKVENLEPSAYPTTPLISSAHFTDEGYTEPGATSTVVKVGEIIGPQVEMYLTDSVRNLPINHGFPRWYHREINLEVPAGYVLKNVESLKMHIATAGDDPEMIFKSEYTYAGSTLKIVVDEWYRGGEYPASQFDIYRAVVNAAADFNKKYVVLQKAQ